jgi:hypothetical protein
MRKISFERFNENDHRCLARNRRNVRCGCQAIAGKRVCKFHGGKSTGPKTSEGKRRAAENLRRYNEARMAAKAAAAAADACNAAGGTGMHRIEHRTNREPRYRLGRRDFKGQNCPLISIGRQRQHERSRPRFFLARYPLPRQKPLGRSAPPSVTV